MDAKLEHKLYEKYPDLFAQRKLSMQETCMCWGIETGDGWYKILDQMCQKIQETGVKVQFTQIKEKFALLRVYTNSANSLVSDIITWAVKLSGVTCEECGERGKLRTGGWLKIRCASCHRRRHYEK